MASKNYFIAGGMLAYGVTSYYYSYASAVRADPATENLPIQDADVSQTYDTIAHSFDKCVASSEVLGLVNWRRRRLAQQAKGNVLEVSVGTGRNMKYYNLDYTWSDWYANTQYAELRRRKIEHEAKLKAIASETEAEAPYMPEVDIDLPLNSPWVEERSKAKELTRTDLKEKANRVNSLTFVDLSAPMVDIARKKFEHKYPGYGAVQFFTQSALDHLPSSPITDAVRRQGGYDYILQSMGLCSTPEPVQLLKHLSGLAHPDRGKILLLEHGKGYWNWMNRYLDTTAPRHAKIHGCWYNRDIGKIVEDSGLVMESCKRKHFGTLWIIEARPRRDADGPAKTQTETEKPTKALSQLVIEEPKEKPDVAEQPDTNTNKPGLASQAWTGLKVVTGIAGLKEEDVGRDKKRSKKDD
ncbi:MAG: hypothetical protein Q9195_002025 [Heterodermia aff. obscurata]